ncbi:MAG TPA: twin-arginine translocase subunit TatC [Anaerolineales bacterium]|nr:twin-arginine translocase subunit TatC [Anaerolineales bacterium]
MKTTVGTNQKGMTNFLRAFWRVITFPFVLAYNILLFPIRAIRRIHNFLNTEPDDRPVMDAFSSLATEQQARQSFVDHIENLRLHLLRSVLVLILGVTIAAFYTRQISLFLIAPSEGLVPLTAIEVTETIGVFMRIALLAGISITIPYIAFELWLFAAPGLTAREKKYSLIGIPLTALFFVGGLWFCYYYLLPTAIPAMDQISRYMGFTNQWRPQSYFAFVTGLMFWMGIAFEFPLVIYFLTSVGFIKPKNLWEQWRIAIVIISIFAAAITPTVDPINMGLVMLPMIFLYFVSIGLSYVAYAGRRRKAASEVTDSGY